MKNIKSNIPLSSPDTYHRSLRPDASPITEHSTLPKVSVVIATLNRPELLERCLGALSKQTLPFHAYDVVVVDDGPHKATEAVVHDWHDRCPDFSVRYCRRSGTAHGPAAARNEGWRMARAAIIAFTDDDCVPAPDWLAAALTALSEPNVGALWGRIRVPVTSRPTDWERNVAGLERAPCATANCFYRRTVLEIVGGFDERFTEAWREDSDLQFGALARGVTILHEPRAVVTHPVRPAPWGISVTLQRQNRFNALLYKKYPAFYHRFNPHEPPHAYYFSVAMLLVGALAAVGGAGWLAAILFGGWLAMAAAFCARRLRGSSVRPAHVIEMIVTSVLIPPYAVFWRLYGAIRYRVAFL
jgi:glycosyltransferase involved in cell wall biosynthesis